MDKVKSNRTNLLIISAFLLTLVCLLPVAGFAKAVLVEAESFTSTGGWVNDQQFMDQMGSPFLLAHGLGKPVEDAKTTVEMPSKGKYKVWVRTRDWVGTWKKPDTPEAKRASGTPGIFRVLIDNKPLEPTFGNEGADWHWQDGGVVNVDKKEIELSLHDLTGFEGRCDAILLCDDINFTPDNNAPGKWRRELLGIAEEPKPAGEFDLVVVGGGVAGVTSAISAARLGLNVALINDRPVLGGNSSSEVKVGIAGRGLYEPYPNVGKLTEEIAWSRKQMHEGKRYYRVSLNNVVTLEDKRRVDLVEEAGVKLFLNYRANIVKTDGSGKITEVVAQNIVNSNRLKFKAKFFADCTGDGVIGFLAGADFDMAQLHMGRSNLWGIKKASLDLTAKFPRCPWALNLSDKPFPGRGGKWKCEDDRFTGLGGWYWESGFEHDPIENGEYIRDWNFRAMYGAWDCLKNVDKVMANYELSRATYISGKRESRRLLGDKILMVQDFKSGKKYDDGCVPTSWRIDVHIPNHHFYQGFEGDGFISIAPKPNSYYKTPYWIPYRCLYSRNISNLFMAGRDISVTHNALGPVRVQWPTGMMGEIVGMAASLCKKYNTDPRGVYQKHLDDLKSLMKKGVGKSKVE